MNNPCISIDRSSSKVGLFDDWSCVRDFIPYTDETMAIEESKAWFAERTTITPTIVYPQITSMKMTTGRVRKSK